MNKSVVTVSNNVDTSRSRLLHLSHCFVQLLSIFLTKVLYNIYIWKITRPDRNIMDHQLMHSVSFLPATYASCFATTISDSWIPGFVKVIVLQTSTLRFRIDEMFTQTVLVLGAVKICSFLPYPKMNQWWQHSVDSINWERRFELRTWLFNWHIKFWLMYKFVESRGGRVLVQTERLLSLWPKDKIMGSSCRNSFFAK